MFEFDTVNKEEKYFGWLKKNSGKLKIWKERFYVLTQTTLLYYTGSDRKKLLGQFLIESAHVESDPQEFENFNEKLCIFGLKLSKL